ncbi:MAG TPA: 3-dehydroquinate synthase [Gemmatimonadales bacterium]|nr:3-dehydroquinate synthase [Gemmatimonadales bacterium]
MTPAAGTPAVTVTHERGEYPVYIEPGILARLPELARSHLGERRTALIADDTVARLYRGFLDGSNAAWRTTERTCNDPVGEGWGALSFPAGEASKSRETWARLTDDLLALGFGRDAALIALGGGVTGDLAGFVAATYMRGVPFLQAPTTLLAMLDASVGGKVGVDTGAGKNLVGAFHPPVAVVADPLTLRTLDDRTYRSGLAEAVKHGLIADEGHLAWIEANAEHLLARDLDRLTLLIRRSVEIKTVIVEADEQEAGMRALLNAGHTVAHALEQATGYAMPHGEAVAIGLAVEAAIGESIGATEPGSRARIEETLARLGLPHALPAGFDPARLFPALARDKKSRGSVPGFVFIEAPGRAGTAGDAWVTPVHPEVLQRILPTLQV